MDLTPPTAARDRAGTTGPCCCSASAGSGKTEVLARRLARLAAAGEGPQRIVDPHLDPGHRAAPAAAGRGAPRGLLRGALDRDLGGDRRAPPARALRRRPGSTPSSGSSAAPSASRSCSTTSTSCRCARQEIRGNPAGLLARLLERIDALKAGAEQPEPELAELCAAHDRILAEAGSIDRGDLFLILNRTALRARRRPRRDRRPLHPLDGRRVRGGHRGPASGPRSLGAENRNQLYALLPAGDAEEGGSRTTVDRPQAPLPPWQDPRASASS